MNLKSKEDEDMSIEEILASIKRYVEDDEPSDAKNFQDDNAKIVADNESLESCLDHNTLSVTRDKDATFTQNDERSDKRFTSNKQNDNFVRHDENVIHLTEAHAVYNTNQDAQKSTLKDEAFSQIRNNNTQLSNEAQKSTVHSIERLLQAQKDQKAIQDNVNKNATTLDQLIANMAKPLITQWLDKNLPQLVELTVTREIENLAKKISC